MTKSVHVCILTTAHPLDDVRVCNKIALTLREEGFRVTWVGPEYAYFDHENYNRYGLEYQLYPAGKTKMDRVFSGRRAYEAALKVPKVDVYYAPEPDSAEVAVKLARRNGAKVVFDVHEVYHDVMLSRWVKGWAFKALRPIARKRIEQTCSRCDLVIGVSHAVIEPYKNAKVEQMIVRSCAPAWFAKDAPADVCGPGRSVMTLMHGKSTLGRGTTTVLEALALAGRETAGVRAVMFDAFVEKAEGFGSPQFRTLLKEMNLESIVDFRKPVPMQEMPAILQSCDVGLISYNRALGLESLPNKLFEYMATGLAILAPSYSEEIVRIVEQEKCGLLVDFEDPQAIADAIVYLRNHPDECRQMGLRARDAFVQRHSWQIEVRPLIERIRAWSSEK
jgi:glycosyltransferase involved in cell wall biosynthesis